MCVHEHCTVSTVLAKLTVNVSVYMSMYQVLEKYKHRYFQKYIRMYYFSICDMYFSIFVDVNSVLV